MHQHCTKPLLFINAGIIALTFFFLPYNIEIFLYYYRCTALFALCPPSTIENERTKHEKENHRVQTKSRQTESDPPTVSLRSDLVAQLVAAYLLGRRAGI